MLRSCAEGLLYSEQLESSLSRNLRTKVVHPSQARCTADAAIKPKDVFYLVEDLVGLYRSYFAIGQREWGKLFTDVLEASSLSANMPSEQPMGAEEDFQIAYKDMAHCGQVEASLGKLTTREHVWYGPYLVTG